MRRTTNQHWMSTTWHQLRVASVSKVDSPLLVSKADSTLLDSKADSPLLVSRADATLSASKADPPLPQGDYHGGFTNGHVPRQQPPVPQPPVQGLRELQGVIQVTLRFDVRGADAPLTGPKQFDRAKGKLTGPQVTTDLSRDVIT